MKEKSDVEKLRTAVIVKLIMLTGACRIKTITKKQIEQSLEKYIKELQESQHE